MNSKLSSCLDSVPAVGSWPCPVRAPEGTHSACPQGFCKQQLWPLFHYVLPMSPNSTGRFDSDLWQAYVKANKIFSDKVSERASRRAAAPGGG